MGYGKTTAVNWYLEQRAKVQPLRIIRISVYSDNLAIFWKSTQDAFARAGYDFLRDYICPTDASGGGLLVDDLCHELAGETSCYIFVDDFHLLTDLRVSTFLCMLASRLPENVHLIVASRDRFLPAAEAVRLGNRAYQIGMEQLRLNHTELAIYAHRCGTSLSDAQVDSLLYSSEGWFSAVYLNLRTLSERGALPDRNSDIYATFTAAMIDPLPEKQREFLAVMGLADEFTVEMAHFVTGDADAEKLLAVLTAQNAFVTCLPDGMTYRFLKPLLMQEIQGGLVQKIIELGEAAEKRKNRTVRPTAFTALTDREYEIVLLMTQRLSNREIAEKLFLSEGSVKQYINQIYSKLHIEGDARSKRARLQTLLL